MPAVPVHPDDSDPTPVGQVAFRELFRFATTYDLVLTAVGLLAAAIVGYGQVYQMMAFGDVMDLGFAGIAPANMPVNKVNASCPSYFCQHASYGLQTMYCKDTPWWNKAAAVAMAPKPKYVFGIEYCSPCTQDEDNMRIFLTFIGIGVICGTCAYIYAACFALAGARMGAAWRKAYMDAILKQDVGWYDVNHPNELPTKISEKTRLVEEGVSSKLGEGTRFVAQAVGGVLTGFVYVPIFAAFLLALSPMCAWGIWYLTKVQGEVTQEQDKAYSKAGGVAGESLSNMRTVAALQCEDKKSLQYGELIEESKRSFDKRATKMGIANGALFSTGNLMVGCGFIFAAWMMVEDVKKGEGTFTCPESGAKFYANCKYLGTCSLTGGEMLVTLFCVQMGSQGLGAVGPTLKAIADARTAAYEILATISRTPPIDVAATGGITKPECKGELKFEGVQFSYPNRLDTEIYAGLTVEMEAGKTTALVGSSGSGKSTAVQLIERFYDPLGGRVLLDGADLKTLDLAWLRQQIGLVGQEPVLFSGTIVENIMMGKDGATRDEAIAAAKMANAHSFITEFEQGYDTDVGSSGDQLSGGQKQRVAIARAIIKDPPILLLDEATSALDNESERVVQAALDDLMTQHKRTTIVIAHRLTTIRGADKIVVLSKGAVVEQGTHDELMAKKAAYFDLVQAAEARESAPAADDSAPSAAGAVAAASTGLVVAEAAVAAGSSPRAQAASLTGAAEAPASAGEADKDKKPTTPEEKAAAKAKAKADGAAVKVVIGRLNSMKEPSDQPLALMGIVGAIFGGAVNPIVGYIFVKSIALFYLENTDDIWNEGLRWGLIMAAAAVVQQLAEMGRAIGFGKIGAKITSKLRKQAFGKLVSMDISFYDKNAAAESVNLLANELPLVQALVGEQTGQVWLIAATFLTGMAIAFGPGSWAMGLLMLGALPIISIGMVIEMSILANNGTKDSEAGVAEKGTSLIGEVVSSVRTVASFSLEDAFRQSYRQAIDEHVMLTKPAKMKQACGPMISQLTLFITFGAMYWYGNKLLLEGDTWAGAHVQIEAGWGLTGAERMLISIFCIFFIGMGLGVAMQGATDMPAATKNARKVFALLDTPQAISNTGGGAAPTACAGAIRFEGVQFSYPNRLDTEIYAGLTVEMEAGKTTALVGSSGSGKSTAVQLIERFYDPLGGRVLLDGADLKTLDLVWLRQQIGLVGQEPVLFSGTIVENIMMGKDGATRDEAIAAAKMANAHSFITEFEQGYDTDVGGSGNQLSGGQKQRIAIARAIVKDPPILLLDEATSALDNESERVVQAALDDLMTQHKRTTIVIAHRLTTIRGADKIVVLSKGAVVEQGTHDELMAMKGFYVGLQAKMQ